MTYSVYTIDLERLADCPEADVIMRLMWGINEMNQLAHLGRLIDKEKLIYPELWKYHEGMTGTLTRQRSARVTEILYTIVRPLVADNASTEHAQINELIESDLQLKDSKKSLRKLFYGEVAKDKESDEFEKHRNIRHRIADHFDHKKDYAIIPESLKLTAQQAVRDEDGKKKGWLIAGANEDNKFIQRFLIADQILNTAWRELILGISLKEEGYADCAESDHAKVFTLDFMRLFHHFASRLIDVYLTKHGLWFKNCKPEELLTPLNQQVPLPEHIAQLDNHSFAEVTSYLGSTRLLADKVSVMYELLMNLIINGSGISQVFDINQTTAIVNCLQALRYSLVMSATTLFRGHVTDTTNYSRRSIEISAFLIEICSDSESARRWIEMGSSGKATARYKSAFQAHQIVSKHRDTLSEDVVDLYDNFCLFVHPSSASMHFQINVTDVREHQFLYFEHQTEKQRANLVTQYFNLLNTHMLLLRALSLFFDQKQIGFAGKTWQEKILQCAAEIDEDKKKWLPIMGSLLRTDTSKDEVGFVGGSGSSPSSVK